ncbi:MAG TPA: argininosuccinate lyase [Euzebyales bacterium]|nr:argininosuccinate lyase [Euzebyales bacterium]
MVSGHRDDATASGRLWGGRFAEGPSDAAWALGRSTHFDARLWRDDLAGSRAHLDELRRLGLVTDGQHERIAKALDAVAREFADGAFAFAATDEDLHGAVERRLIELAGDDGGRLRAGRSRNDQIATDLRRYLRREITQRLVPAVSALQLALVDQAEGAVDMVAPGYTHLQRAQPVTVAHHLLAHAWALERDAGRLADAAARMDASALGAGALAGTTLPLDPQRYAAALGFSRVVDNSMDAVADRDFAVEFLAAAALLGVHLSRLGEEIVLWTSTEFSWARLGEAFSTGSSIMPQKRNPDVAELVRGKSGRLVGDLVSLLVTLKGLPLTYNRDLQEDKEPVFDAVDTLDLALPAMQGAVASLEFDAAGLAAKATDGFALATDLAEALVGAGVPFREAHERVGRFVAECERAERTLDDASSELPRVFPELTDGDDAMVGLLSASGAVERRRSIVGPSAEAVGAQLRSLRAACLGRIDQARAAPKD